jgi:hypothetical protein
MLETKYVIWFLDMEEFNWKLTINVNIVMLKVVGLWPEENGSYKLNWYTVYAICSNMLFQVVHTLTQLINLGFIYDDLQALTGTSFVLSTELLTLLKTYYFVKNMRVLKKLMLMLNDNSFQPKTPKQKILAEDSLKFWKRIYISLCVTAGGALVFWAVFPIFDGSLGEYRLPFLAWYPYDTQSSPLYEITYVYQMISNVFICACNLDMDTLIAALNMYTAAQFDFLCDNLRNLESGEDSFDGQFRKCIAHHRQILR